MTASDVAHQMGAQPPPLAALAAAHPAVRRIVRLARRARYYLYVRSRYRTLRLERVNGLPTVVLPGVFNPRLFHTGEMLARYVAGIPLSPSAAVLDLGCGTGVAAIAAARRGARVVAVDVNPEAVRCTRINALLNGVEGNIDIREGDLFRPVNGERFDLVLFNPPFFPGRAGEPWEHAWRSEDVLERFVRDLPRMLAPAGRALVVLSTVAGDALDRLHASDMRVHIVAERRLLTERLFIVEVAP